MSTLNVRTRLVRESVNSCGVTLRSAAYLNVRDLYFR